jgi:arylsulfatase A-like enzyme
LLREQLRDYRALVGHLDAQIDRILAALDATGQRDNTLVVFAADHGLALGSHGLLGKQSLYEHSMRAPVILAGPGLPAGSVRHDLAYLLDLHETILAATAPPLSPGEEAPAPAEFARDLLPVARGEATGREEVYLAYADGQRALVTAKDKLIRLPQIDRSLWFDLHGDPHELTPTAIAAERRAALTERLQAWERTRGTNLPWTADKLLPAELDLTGKRWPPDRWQPQWILDKFFPAGGQASRK